MSAPSVRLLGLMLTAGHKETGDLALDVQDARLAREEQEVVAIYKALKEQRQKARVMADRAAEAAQQLAEAQRRLDMVNAAMTSPSANGADLQPACCTNHPQRILHEVCDCNWV